jgi:hypothetical protein
MGGVHMKGLPDCAPAVKVQKMENGSRVDQVEMENGATIPLRPLGNLENEPEKCPNFVLTLILS